MKSKKVFYVMIGLLAFLCVLIIASVVVGDKLLRKTSDKLTALKLDNQIVEAQQASLVQANKDIQKYADLKTVAKQIVPQDKDQARATREILALADQAGIKIASITFPASTLGQTPPKAPASTSGDTPAPAAPPAPAVTQVKPVEGIKGLFQLDITVVSDTSRPVTYGQFISFLEKLEQNRRTSQVSQITVQPIAQNRSSLNFSLIVTVYIKP